MPAAAVRVDQSTGEVDALRREFDRWISARLAGDELGNYRTQLGSLEVFVEELIAVTREDADVSLRAPVGEIYDACREIDGRVAFIRRLWAYFRERFDQRMDRRPDPEGSEDLLTLPRMLAAADEIAWSCWAEAHRRADPSRDPPVVPLPFVQSEVIPDATVRRLVPYDLRPTDELLATHVEALPIPTIGIPEACVRHPWWLAYLVHEVGHHLHHELAGGVLFGGFNAVLAGAAVKGSTWPVWHEEVFADIFSALSLGPAAIWSLLELVTAAPTTMLTADSLYPSPVERVELLWAVVKEAGGERGPEQAWGDAIAGTKDPGVERRRAEIPALAKAVVQAEMLDGQRLMDLAGWERDRNDDAEDLLAAALLAGRPPDKPDTSVRGPRRAISAGVSAWRMAGAIEDPKERSDTLQRLAEALVTYVPTCREPGTRAGHDLPKAALVAQAGELTASLRRLKPTGALFEGR